MEVLLKEKLSIDKTNWNPVKFGDVAFEPKESSKDPIADGIKHVVGLEHIESENIHLRRSASIEESTTFSKKFSSGDVLFGRRRAYLKKAAQANFSGICSGDITVMRAKEGLLPQLLPFIVNNEKFFDFAVKHSAGGLSPRVKFKDLANYEFLLPPKEQQAQLAELLWAMDEVIEREKEVLNSSKIMLSVEQRKHYSEKYEDKVKLGDIATIRAGYGFPIKHQGQLDKSLKFFKVADMNTEGNERYMHISQNTIDDEILACIKGKTHPKGTVIFPKVGAAIATEKKRILIDESIVDNNTMGVTLTTDVITPEYLHDYFTRISLQSLSNVGAVPSINASIISDIRIGLPSKNILESYMNLMEALHSTINVVEIKIKSSQSLQRSLINQVF